MKRESIPAVRSVNLRRRLMGRALRHLVGFLVAVVAVPMSVFFVGGCGDDTVVDAGPMPADAASDGGVSDGSVSDGDVADGTAVDVSRPDAETTSRIEIGTGITEFMPVTEGDTMELVAGPQGGWHLDIALKLYGVEPDLATLRLSGVDATTGDPLTIRITRSLTRRRVLMVDDYFLRLGDQLVFDIEEPSIVTDRDVRVAVELEEAGGLRTMAELVVHVVDDVR